MTKLPDITGYRVVKALQKNDWFVKSQKGSHVKLTKDGCSYFLIVPVHGGATVPKGTLSNILKDAGLTADEFNALL
jgi:predicted RNA binding protein YcfA (HicA-like mRNA interferase family)